MTRELNTYKGLSGSLWPFATVTITDSQMALRKSQTEVITRYRDIQYVTVSWLGTIQFHLEVRERQTYRPEESFSFLSTRTPELLVALAAKNIPVGGHVLRRLFVSQFVTYTVLYAVLLALFVAGSMFIPGLRNDPTSILGSNLLVFYVIFATSYATSSVRRYVKGAPIDRSKQDDDDWFPWD